MRPDPMETQPPVWEEQLKDVTVESNYREIVMDPVVLNQIIELCQEDNPIGKVISVFDDEGLRKKITEAKSVVRRKMKGVRRNCMLLLLTTGDDYHAIACKMRISYDTARRHVLAGTNILKQHFSSQQSGEFPARQGTRPTVRTALFPLDTSGEKTEFQTFLNRHVVTHVAYSAQAPFREALVVYLSGKNTVISDSAG